MSELRGILREYLEGHDLQCVEDGPALGVANNPARIEARIAQEIPHPGTLIVQLDVVTTIRPEVMIIESCAGIGGTRDEAILNALTHSEGSHVEAEITYDPRQLRLRIRDNGRGFDADIIEQGGRPDHWGLRGMRERANRIGARLELWSRSNAGTEVELLIPGATAYGALKSKRKRW